MSFSQGNGFTQFAKEIPRGSSVFQRVSPNNPPAGYAPSAMSNQGNPSAAPSSGSASTTHHRILYPENALEFGNLQLQAPPSNVTPADLGNAPRDSNRAGRTSSALPSAASNVFGGPKAFSSASRKDGFGSQPQNTFTATSNVLPGFGAQSQQQTSFATQKSSNVVAQSQQQPSFATQHSYGSQQSSFVASPEEKTVEPQYNTATHIMPNSVHHRHQASFGQSNTSENFPSAQTSSHARVSPVPQNYGQPSPVQHASYTSAPQTPVHNNQTQEGNQCSGNTVTADQVDALMKYFEAANFATSGFLDILADAGEKFIALRGNYSARFN